MKRKQRFIIEGEWSGYRSSQQRVVHRTVHSASSKKLRAWAEKTRSIQFTDGTGLWLKVRDCKPRERVQVIHGYDSLIDKCWVWDVTSVEELRQKETISEVMKGPILKDGQLISDSGPVRKEVQ